VEISDARTHARSLAAFVPAGGEQPTGRRLLCAGQAGRQAAFSSFGACMRNCALCSAPLVCLVVVVLVCVVCLTGISQTNTKYYYC
jgi:hypothetical protein